MPTVPVASALEVQVFGATDKGLQRSNNEDKFVIANLTTGESGLPKTVQQYRLGSRGALFLVSDGMGGEQAGEVASGMCAELMPQKLKELLVAIPELDEHKFLRALDEAIQHANTRIHEKAEATVHERGMGCTLTGAAVLAQRLYVAQIGDSRAYLVRGEEIKQLTEDQTLGTYLASLNSTMAREIAANTHNILTQAVGAAPVMNVRYTRVDLASGDRLLVCSDGLYNMVPDEEIFQVLTFSKTLLEASRELIQRANARGGPDNITVIVAQFRLSGQGPSASLPPLQCVEISLPQ